MNISTIIPIYNAGKYLNRCIDSIIAAQIDGVSNEIILINDGSTDNSLQICHEYKRNYPNIIVLEQENKGPSEARNHGLKTARGEYITFVDSDDFVEEKYFKTIETYLGGNQDIVIFGFNKVINDTIDQNILIDELLERKAIIKRIRKSSEFMNLFWFPHTKVYKASLLNNLKFNANIFIGEDTVFNIEAMARSQNVQTIAESLYNYVYNKNSLTGVQFRENLLSNMTEHYNARIAIHDKFKELQDKLFYKDISKYYLEHILFWIFRNIKNSPDNFYQVEELKNTRNSIIYKECFRHYSYNWKHPKRSLFIKLFEHRQFRLLLKLIN